MRAVIFIVFLSLSLFASSSKMSSVPLPKMVFINLDTVSCDANCLKKYANEQRYFSFLAHYNPKEQDDEVFQVYTKLNSSFLLSSSFSLPEDMEISGEAVRVALLVPQKVIQRYAITTTNSVIAYLFSRNVNFDVQVFNSYDESEASLQRELDNIKRMDYKLVIAPLTPKGATYVAKNSEGLAVYIPTIHKEFEQIPSDNIIYGGISYQKQIQKLANFTNGQIAIFSDGSALSSKLNSAVKNEFGQVIYQKSLDIKNMNLKTLSKNRAVLNESSIFLNTPIVKSSLIASQLRANDIYPHAILSTQINYNPSLINYTQYEDRKKMYIANSIQETPFLLSGINSIFGHSIVYDWVNYATSVGIDFILTRYFYSDVAPLFHEHIEGNQVVYETQIMKSSPYGFYPITQ